MANTLSATADSIWNNGLSIDIDLPEIDWPYLWRRFTNAIAITIAAVFIAGYLTGKLTHLCYAAGRRLRERITRATYPIAGLLPAAPTAEDFSTEATANPLPTAILRLRASGLSQRAIAQELNISRSTVRKHLA